MPGFVAVVGERQIALRPFDGDILLLKFLGQDSSADRLSSTS